MVHDASKGAISKSTGRRSIRRALICVHDKTDVGELARVLHSSGVSIVSTGSTAAAIEAMGVPVQTVADLTGFPECLGGRLKTLHPVVHGGLLADMTDNSHVIEMAELGIEPFDLLVANFYPFQEVVAGTGSVEECISNIDIGGPAMVRAAAKNHESVAVVTSPAMYDRVRTAAVEGGFSLQERRNLAAEAFALVARYDLAVAEWSAKTLAPGPEWPQTTGMLLKRTISLRYGENPHQKAALYCDQTTIDGLARAEQLHGPELSFTNYLDIDAAWRAVHEFTEPTAVVSKHANPCGIATGTDIRHAYRQALACDPVSAYGGIIAINREMTAGMAEDIGAVLTHAIIAPSYSPAALSVLMKKKNIRLLKADIYRAPTMEFRQISGGWLVQEPDRIDADGDSPGSWKLVAGPRPSDPTMRDLSFAWRAIRSVKSNAILIASSGAAIGIGMGQVNRVDAARQAVSRAGTRCAGAVAASDAFFPFADGIEVLIEAGVKAIVQPGGSIRDDEVICAAESAEVTMFLTGVRHFCH